jgi:hypothetical protein
MPLSRTLTVTVPVGYYQQHSAVAQLQSGPVRWALGCVVVRGGGGVAPLTLSARLALLGFYSIFVDIFWLTPGLYFELGHNPLLLNPYLLT